MAVIGAVKDLTIPGNDHSAANNLAYLEALCDVVVKGIGAGQAGEEDKH